MHMAQTSDIASDFIQRVTRGQGVVHGPFNELSEFEVPELLRVIPGLAGTGSTGSALEGIRDAAWAHLDLKLTQIQVEASKRLEESVKAFDSSSSRLARAMIAIAVLFGVVQIALTVVQVWLALR